MTKLNQVCNAICLNKDHMFYSLYVFSKPWCFVLQGLPAAAIDNETLLFQFQKLTGYEITQISI